MKLYYYTGFNMYGQIRNVRDRYIINSFTNYELDDNFHDIECGHFFTTIHFHDNKITINGAANKKLMQNIKLDVSNNIISQTYVKDNALILLKNDGRLLKVLLDDTSTVLQLPDFIRTEYPDLNDIVIKAAFNSKMSVFLTDGGKVFNFSTSLDISEEVQEISTGIEHCLLLSKSGNVYSFGQGSRGQLGHGLLENESNPILIQALGGIRIVKIATGGWHSCALSADGDLYTWGWNGNGQLGIKYNNDIIPVMATPHLVDIDSDENLQFNIISVACGNRHTVFLLDDNNLYGMGWNKYSQLGDKAKWENNYLPILIYKFGEQMSTLKCGPWSTIVY